MTEEKKKENGSKPAPVEEEVRSYYYPEREANLGEVKRGYSIWRHNTILSMILILVPVIAANIYYMYNRGDIVVDVFFKFREMIVKEFELQTPQTIYFILSVAFLTLLLLEVVISVLLSKRLRPVYLLDFAVFQPPEKYKITHEFFCKHTENVGWFDKESIEFQKKLLYRTGLGNDTYFPEGITKEVPDTSMQSARDEALLVLSGCLDDLFAKTKIKPEEIDILIVNCSLFNPTPSLAAMMMNKYKMRHDCLSYNLAGMGCSAGVISIDLAKQLLQVHKNSIAVVLSTENITQNWYRGNERAMLLTNTLFRMGGAAIMLSNKPSHYWSAKYKLVASVRVTKAASDTAYNAVYQMEDPLGNKGVRLATGRDLMGVVGDALKTNLTILGPMVLPWSEQIKFFLNLCRRKLSSKKMAPYVPDFKKAFQHICIHAGGRAVIDGLEQNFNLTPYDVEPSRATLYRYGNTSSSSIWYELNFIEKQHHVKRGEKVWQLAFGSGFKCNSAVWQAITNI